MRLSQPSLRLVTAGVFSSVVLGLATACGSAASPTPGPVEVTVRLGAPTEFTIESSLKEFQPGRRYRFVVSNHGTVPHEFMIMPRGREGAGGHGAGHMDAAHMDTMHEEALLAVDPASLGPGMEHMTEVVFPEAPEAGDLEFACKLPGHYEAGMKLPVNIQKS